MQILGNILPGFRDIRAPIIAGYTWLVLAWLLIRPDIHRRPADAAFGSLYDLGHDVGRLGVAVGVSVAAYLIGSVSQGVTDALATLVADIRDPLRFGWWPIWVSRALPLERIERARERADEALADIAHGVIGEATYRNLQSSLSIEVETRTNRALSDARKELGLPATLLVGDKPELFAEVDRLRSEGELRITVTLPLAAL